MTCEQMKENFEKVGWSNIHFEEITKEIALKEGLTFAISGIEKGEQFFRMIETGNIFKENGEVVMYKIV